MTDIGRSSDGVDTFITSQTLLNSDSARVMFVENGMVIAFISDNTQWWCYSKPVKGGIWSIASVPSTLRWNISRDSICTYAKDAYYFYSGPVALAVDPIKSGNATITMVKSNNLTTFAAHTVTIKLNVGTTAGQPYDDRCYYYWYKGMVYSATRNLFCMLYVRDGITEGWGDSSPSMAFYSSNTDNNFQTGGEVSYWGNNNVTYWKKSDQQTYLSVFNGDFNWCATAEGYVRESVMIFYYTGGGLSNITMNKMAGETSGSYGIKMHDYSSPLLIGGRCFRLNPYDFLLRGGNSNLSVPNAINCGYMYTHYADDSIGEYVVFGCDYRWGGNMNYIKYKYNETLATATSFTSSENIVWTPKPGEQVAFRVPTSGGFTQIVWDSNISGYKLQQIT